MPMPDKTKNTDRKSLSKLFGGDFPVFLLFLVVAFFFWWSLSMNSNYETVVNVPVRLENVPEDMRITYDLPPSVTVSLSGKGTSLMKAARMCRKHVIGLDCGHFVTGSQRAARAVWDLRDSLASFLPQAVMVRGITPDTLAFEFVHQNRKLLPVVVSGEFKSVDQFFVESVTFSPDSVWTYLLDSDIDVVSVPVNVEGMPVGTDFLQSDVALNPLGGSVPLQPTVSMSVYAEQYIEKRVDVPISAIGFPTGVHLKTFPSRASVIGWVKMSDYDRLSERDFKVGVDFLTLNSADGGKAEVVLMEKPVGVKNIRVMPGFVEYLLEKDL